MSQCNTETCMAFGPRFRNSVARGRRSHICEFCAFFESREALYSHIILIGWVRNNPGLFILAF